MNPALKWLVPAIFFLAAAAAVCGVMPGAGEPFAATSARGEALRINARGLYHWDTVSSAAQMQANDLVTLALGLPLLAASFVLALRGSLRGRLVLTGTLGFVLYTYITMCFGAAYNPLFLVYVALFSLSLFAFILCLKSFDVADLPARFSDRLPRRLIVGLLFFAAAFLSLAWLGRIMATFGSAVAPQLENTTSMFIQAMDLGIVVPACALSGILLLKRRPWGYLLASVCMVKFLTLGTAVSVMGFNMARVGIPVSPVELLVFPVLALANATLTVAMLKSLVS